MSLDISDILRDWPFKPGEVNVRRILGEDGLEKIQLRLDLGMLQMETQGRPDGQEPHGHESLLGYYEHLLEEHRQEHGSDEGFRLDSEACELLRIEGVMFYHRYLAEFVLGDYEAVQRDTRRNLKLFDFCHRYAEEDTDREILQQYRPYVMMMHTRAGARMALNANRPKKALSIVRRAIRAIRAFYERYDAPEAVEQSTELAVLKALAREVKALIPVDPATKLRKQLRQAIAEERYEDAADLRDQLEQLRTTGAE